MRLSDLKPTEAQIQGRLVQRLRLAGYTVLVTGAGIAPVVGKDGKKQYGKGLLQTPGVPDLLVSHDKWPSGCWIGIEMKRDAKARVSPEQQELARRGRIFVCWDDEDAERLVKTFGLVILGVAGA